MQDKIVQKHESQIKKLNIGENIFSWSAPTECQSTTNMWILTFALLDVLSSR